jgi:hypothetical protein
VNLGLVIAAIGLAMLAWPRPFLGLAGLYRSGSVLSLGARVHAQPLGVTAKRTTRMLGLILLLSGLFLIFAMS